MGDPEAPFMVDSDDLVVAFYEVANCDLITLSPSDMVTNCDLKNAYRPRGKFKLRWLR
jgi:hypothetical protein